MQRPILLTLLSILLAFSAIAQEPVYRWRDPQGSVHYSTKPPEGVQAEPVDLNAKPVGVTAAERVYTWQDDEGKIHYGDRPPAGREAKLVDMESKNLSTIRATEFRAGERELLQELETQSKRPLGDSP